LNVPLGLIGLALSSIFIPNEHPAEMRALDVGGLVLSGGACSALMYGMDVIAHNNASWLLAAGLLAASFVLGVFAVRHSVRHRSPLLDLSALTIRTFAVTIGGGSLFRIAISAVPFLLPLMFQVGFGLSAFSSGLLVLALFAGNLAMKPLTTPVLRRCGFRSVLIVNGVLTGVTILTCAMLTPNTPRTVILGTLFFGGLCRSMQFTSLNTLGFADVPRTKMSGANTFFSMVQQLTLAIGIAFGAVALQMALLIRGKESARLELGDFHLAFIFVAMIALLAVLDCFGLDSNAGAVVSGRSQPLGKAVGAK